MKITYFRLIISTKTLFQTQSHSEVLELGLKQKFGSGTPFSLIMGSNAQETLDGQEIIEKVNEQNKWNCFVCGCSGGGCAMLRMGTLRAGDKLNCRAFS